MATDPEVVKAQNRERIRRFREKKRAADAAAAAAPASNALATAGAGPVRAGIERELVNMPKAQAQPGILAMAIALADVVDSGPATARVQAATRLYELMKDLRGGSTRGRLAEIRDKAGG